MLIKGPLEEDFSGIMEADVHFYAITRVTSGFSQISPPIRPWHIEKEKTTADFITKIRCIGDWGRLVCCRSS